MSSYNPRFEILKMFCERCEGIELASGKDDRVSYTHSDNIEALHRSSQKGCEGCSFFHDMLMRYLSYYEDHRRPDPPDDTNRIVIVSSTNTDSVLGQVWVAAKGSYDCIVYLEPFLIRAECANDERVSGRDIGSDVGSGQSLAWIQECLRQCLGDHDQHPNCANTPDEEVEMPLRLLDLSGLDEESDVFIKVNSDGCLRGRYAALSHRWGERTPLISTADNIEAHQNNISWGKLPESFQDAIRLCRRLSVPYLWVDSLCILQNSPSDWTAQSTKMADIYSHANVVLALSSAWDSTYRVLKTRDPIRSLRLFGTNSHIHLRDSEDENLNRFHHSPRAVKRRHYRRDFLNTTKSLATLGSRGWAFQERLLARRTIFFTPCQLAWQCQSRVLVESSIEPETAPDGLDLASNVYASPDTALKAWEEVVVTYSTLDLTYGTDKLVALAGLSQRFKSSIFDTYVAGLWRSSLPYLLSWRAIGKPWTRSEEYRAPSWSWASFDGEISFPSKFLRTHGEPVVPAAPLRQLRILDVHVETVGDSEFGPVKDASLCVRGHCMPITREGKDWTVTTIDGAQILRPSDFQPNLDVRDEFWERSEKRPRVRIWIGPGLLALQLMRWSWVEIPWKSTNFCLLLAEVDGRVGTYRRVGIAKIDGKAEDQQPWEERELILI